MIVHLLNSKYFMQLRDLNIYLINNQINKKRDVSLRNNTEKDLHFLLNSIYSNCKSLLYMISSISYQRKYNSWEQVFLLGLSGNR